MYVRTDCVVHASAVVKNNYSGNGAAVFSTAGRERERLVGMDRVPTRRGIPIALW